MFERGRKDADTHGEPAGQDGGWSGRSGKGAPGEAAVIGRSIQIGGDLRGDEDLRIEGDVSGKIELRSSSLTIGKEGRVRAQVYAKVIIVDGKVEGDLYASERVSIRASAQVLGNVTAPRVGLEDGARFKGSVEMDQEAVNRAFGQKKSAPESTHAPKTADTKLGAPLKGAATT